MKSTYHGCVRRYDGPPHANAQETLPVLPCDKLRGSRFHSRPNHAPHTERNVCRFAKARLSELSVGQMHRTQRHTYGRLSLPRTGEGEDLFPQLASAQRMRHRSGARLNPHLNPLPLPKAEANFMRMLTS